MSSALEHPPIPLAALGDWRRDSYCGLLRREDVGRDLTALGWVGVRRDHGGIVFIDLRDRTGVLQIVFDPDLSPAAHALAHDVRSEYVIAVQGRLALRPPETLNTELPTGEVELRVGDLRVLSSSRVLPFPLEDEGEANEAIRSKHRYLDLRRPRILQNLQARHRATGAIRSFLDERSFIEVETPILTRSTPEGARDYIVPSRIHPGTV
jgi:aspartyl-tRNA synthetase